MVLKLADFELSQRLDENGMAWGYNGGSTYYAAPEVWVNGGIYKQKISGEALDVWSLAVTLFVMEYYSLQYIYRS